MRFARFITTLMLAVLVIGMLAGCARKVVHVHKAAPVRKVVVVRAR